MTLRREAVSSALLLLLVGAVTLVSSSSVCTLDTQDLLTCSSFSTLASARYVRPVAGLCLGCCAQQVNTTSSAVCTTHTLRQNMSSASSATVNRCLSDGGQVMCPDVSASSTTIRVSVVTGLCLRATSCVSPCGTSLSIGRMQCTEVDVEVNTSQCIWLYANEPSIAQCNVADGQLMRGACISSSAALRSCQNYSSAVLCCPIINPTVTPTVTSLSTTPQVDTKTVDPSFSLKSRTLSSSASMAPTLSSSATKRILTASVTPTHSNATVDGLSHSHQVTPTSKLASPTNTLHSSATHAMDSPTATLPSMTRQSSFTKSVQPTVNPVAVISPTLVDALTFAKLDVSLTIALNGSQTRWRPETVPFIDQAMTGTQPWNPFAFDAQKEVLFAGVSLPSLDVSQDQFSILQIRLRKDQCLDVRYDEEVFLSVGVDYFEPTNSTMVLRDGADSRLTVRFTIHESPTHQTRRNIGLAVSIIVTVLLIISGLLGNPGISLLTFCEFQMINVIGRQSCSRGIIAAYFDDSFWVVTPTMKATSFIDDDDLGADFGVILVHTVFAVLFFAVVVVASRLRKRVRMLFPSLPLGVVYILFIGATNAAWRSAIFSDKPGPAVGSMVLWVVFFLAIGATVWRIRSPRGLLFLRYHRGLFSWVLRGTHSPLQLRGKYSLMIDLWHENFVEFASPIHLLHLSISSIVCAFSSGSPLLCFPVLGTQMVWQSLVFLMTLFSLPGRSPFHNSLLILHSLMPLFLIAAATLSLDCLMAKNFYLAEWFTVITLVGYFLSAVLQVWMSFVERRYRADVERELKDITAKHRRIVFFMDDAGLTDQRDRLPPISKHFITPKLIDPDWRSKRHKDMFSFPLLRETDAREGDAWSSALTGMTAASAAERLRQSKQNTTLADNDKQQERWSTYEHIERGNNLNDDDDDEYAAYDDMMQPLPPAAVAENNNNSLGGVTVDAFGNSLRSDNGGGGAAAGGSSWVSARHDPTSAFTLKPLASQLRLNPYATSRSVEAPPPTTQHHQATPWAQSNNIAAEQRLQAEKQHRVRPHHQVQDTSTSPPQQEQQQQLQQPPRKESVGRCSTCRRWIILEEGCDNCGLA